MPSVNVVVESPISRSPRARQLEGMFDVPPAENARLEWAVELPIEEEKWNVGLIVGPSGCGKTTIAREIWGKLVDRPCKWGAASVIDDFAKRFSMEEIAKVCSAVGFNTVPAWLRPFKVLSNGEQFRVTLARRLLEGGDLIVVDEFTSVVDRQVAQIGSHAVQKFIRRADTQFVGVSCHYDIVDWLQPDWVYAPAERRFERRRLRPRPKLEVSISPVPYSAWGLFAPFHYLTAKLNPAARVFALFVGDRIAAVAAMLYRPINRQGHIPLMGCSRLVTLPDFQGLGLAFVIIDKVASLYKAVGRRTHTYPAHPALIRAFDRSKLWAMRKRPGVYSPTTGLTSTFGYTDGVTKQGGRPCAIFSYEGPAADPEEARRVFAYWPGHITI